MKLLDVFLRRSTPSDEGRHVALEALRADSARQHARIERLLGPRRDGSVVDGFKQVNGFMKRGER